MPRTDVDVYNSDKKSQKNDDCWKKEKSLFSSDKKSDNRADHKDNTKKSNEEGKNPWGRFQNKEKFAEMHWC